MTAANVATTPQLGRTMGKGVVGTIALTVGLLAGIAVGSLALRPATTAATQAVTPAAHSAASSAVRHSRVAATVVNPLANYAQVVANLKAAESEHDFASRYRFERQLDRMLTAPVIGSIYLEQERLTKSLAEAKATGNGYGIWRIGQDLSALCGSASVRAKLDFCK